MNDEFPPPIAVDRAWTIYLATHANVDAADHRRCTLERYLCDRWHAGESDPEELARVFRFYGGSNGTIGELRSSDAG